MSCLLYLIFWPFIFIWYSFNFLIYFIVFIGKIIWNLLGIPLSSYDEEVIKSSSNKYKKKEKSYKDLEFDEEADLWGLSKEDRRIAKQERMSPADFIEAEERDDDVLDTDEWEE